MSSVAETVAERNFQALLKTRKPVPAQRGRFIILRPLLLFLNEITDRHFSLDLLTYWLADPITCIPLLHQPLYLIQFHQRFHGC
jgi:hypothetical protein